MEKKEKRNNESYMGKGCRTEVLGSREEKGGTTRKEQSDH